MRYLVVSNQTLDDESLLRTMLRAAQRTNATFHVLVPSTPPDAHHGQIDAFPLDSPTVRLSAALARFGQLGLRVTGEVGDADPWSAISTVCARGDCDRVIIATLPRSISRWLRMDLPHRISRRWHVLVEWVTVSDRPGQPGTLATIRPIAPPVRV